MTPLLTGVFASQISGHLDTFTPTGSYDAITSYTVGAGGISSVTFSGIPSGYKHLQVRMITRYSGNDLYASMILNSDTTGSNYIWHQLVGSGSSATSNSGASMFPSWWLPNNGSTGDVFCATVVDILDYASTTKNKTFRYLTGYDTNGGGRVELDSGLWMNTSAVNSINFNSTTFGSTSSFAQYTQFSLYGVKG